MMQELEFSVQKGKIYVHSSVRKIMYSFFTLLFYMKNITAAVHSEGLGCSDLRFKTRIAEGNI